MNVTITRSLRRVRVSLAALSFAGAAVLATTAEAATYDVTFDTSVAAGRSGSIDFQWNLGTLDPSLTAVVANFGGPSLSDPATLLFGQVTGTLAPAGSLMFAATDPFNYIYQTLSFGTRLSFRLTLPDTAPLTANAIPSEFVVSLFDSALVPVLPTTSPDGAALLFTLVPGGRPVTTPFSAVTVAQVPEPGPLALILAGLMAMVVSRRAQGGPSGTRRD